MFYSSGISAIVQYVINIMSVDRASAFFLYSACQQVFGDLRNFISLRILSEYFPYGKSFRFVDYIFFVYNVIPVDSLSGSVSFKPAFANASAYFLRQFFRKVLIESFQ